MGFHGAEAQKQQAELKEQMPQEKGGWLQFRFGGKPADLDYNYVYIRLVT